MITKDFIKIQRKLIEKKIELLQKEISQNKKYEDLGSTDEDKAKEFENFEERTALSRSEKKEIKNLKNALGRIDKGTYGKCKVDGEPIEIGRLKIYPEAEYCATHAKTNQ